MADYQRMQSRSLVSQQDAAHIESANVPRSKFVNNWSRKTAFDAGYLVPILVDEVLPGDHLTYNITAYLRMSTPLFPLLDTQRVDTFFFYVPMRLVWDNFVKMMGEQANPGDSINYSVPLANGQTAGDAVGSIYDHMGIVVAGQVSAGNSMQFNCLPFRCYNLIFNEWFRDENLTLRAPVDRDDATEGPGKYQLMLRSKSHDYFTSALPWPQKFTAPTVPLAGFAPVIGIGINRLGWTHTPTTTIYESDGTSGAYAFGATQGSAVLPPWAPGNSNTYIDVDGSTGYPKIYADLAQSTGVAINTLRQAFLVQQLLERDARGGTRYIEKIRSHFGVVSPDFRLARPEYIGGGQSPLNITPIAQTAPTTGVPLGALGAAGSSAGTHRASYAATEHGYIIGLINVRTELSYQQGVHRMYYRRTVYDFYWPTLAGLGEQAILQREIYATANPATDVTVFGYQERWQEYRTRYSDVTGIMRSTATGTLDAWHLSQKFATAPLLNDSFVKDQPPMARVLAAGTAANGQQYLADINYHRVAVRPIPTYGTPVTLGRF